MKRTNFLFLSDILKSINYIEKFTKGFTMEKFLEAEIMHSMWFPALLFLLSIPAYFLAISFPFPPVPVKIFHSPIKDEKDKETKPEPEPKLTPKPAEEDDEWGAVPSFLRRPKMK